MLTIGCFFKIFNKVVHNTHHESLEADFFMNSLHQSQSVWLPWCPFPSRFSSLMFWWKTPHLRQMLSLSMTCHILGLIYQSNVETSADPCAQINLWQSSCVIHETFVCRQSHRANDRTLINVVAENNRCLNITLLKTASPLEFTTLRNELISLKRNWSYSKKHPLTL